MWAIEELTGYKPKTNFWRAFTEVDEVFIENAMDKQEIEENLEKLCSMAFSARCKNNVEALTELVMVVNWKIFEHYEKHEVVARAYDKVWRELDQWCIDNLKGEDLKYYLRTTD